MQNRERPFESLYEALEAFCAEVLCNGEDGAFWEHYRDEGGDIEKYILRRDYEDGMGKFLDWLWSESTKGKSKPREDEFVDEAGEGTEPVLESPFCEAHPQPRQAEEGLFSGSDVAKKSVDQERIDRTLLRMLLGG